MGDVEILEPDDPPPPADPPAPRRGLRLAPPVLALAGGAVTLVAPFTTAYRLQLPGFAGGDLALDGWGRYDRFRTFAPSGQHGPRLGIAFCVAAAAVLAGLVLWRFAGARLRRAGSGAMLVAAGVTAATAASALLDALATADSYQVVLRDNRPTNFENLQQPDVTLTPGPMLWCGAAAAVLLVAAVIVRAVTPVDVRADLPEHADPPEPLHRDDELLG